MERRIWKSKNFWAVRLRSKFLRKIISFPASLNCQDVYQLTLEFALKSVIPVLKLKRKAHLNSSYKKAVLTLKLTCHTIKCGKSIQRQKKALLVNCEKNAGSSILLYYRCTALPGAFD